MENRLFSYKSFLAENSNDMSSQMEGFEMSRRSLMVQYAGKYDWNPEINGLDFDSELLITQKFKGKSLSELPFKIGDVGGIFDCSGLDNLQNLIGSPRSCFDFCASYCALTSLAGAPEIVNTFNVENNLLTSLKFGPKYVFGNFDIRDNMLSDLDFGPRLILGEVKMLGNRKKLGGVEYSAMHKEIQKIYVKDGHIIEDEIAKQIEDDIAKKNYPFNVLIKNPAYSKFLGEFKKDIEEWDDILTKGKDFGLI